MSPREGFGVLVRAGGLAMLFHGGARALGSIMMNDLSLYGFWIHTLLTIVLGCWMLRGAKPLVAWAYRGE